MANFKVGDPVTIADEFGYACHGTVVGFVPPEYYFPKRTAVAVRPDNDPGGDYIRLPEYIWTRATWESSKGGQEAA